MQDESLDKAGAPNATDDELVAVFEAVLFLAAEPMSHEALREVAMRHAERRGVRSEVAAVSVPPSPALPEVPRQGELMLGLPAQVASIPEAKEIAPQDSVERALMQLRARWQADENSIRGLVLVEVAGGLALRTHPRVADVILSLRAEKPIRLSRAALETLALVAYQQPITRPEVDQVRGVDSGGTLKALLDRQLIAICGKKEEPGRPMLYGTTPEFLSFFGLASLAALPTLREYDELSDDSSEQLRAFDGLPSLEALSKSARQYRIDDATEVDDLDAAVSALGATAQKTRDALLEEGVQLNDEEPGASSASPTLN